MPVHSQCPPLQIIEHRERVELKIQAGLVTSPAAKPQPKAAVKPAARPPPAPEASAEGGGGGMGMDISFDEPSKPTKKRPVMSSQKRRPKKDVATEEGEVGVPEDEVVKKKPIPKQV